MYILSLSFNNLFFLVKKTKNKFSLLPLEYAYLSKNAKIAYPDTHQTSKHFKLMRLAKSAALMQDIKLKAINYQKIKKTNEKLASNLGRAFAKNSININLGDMGSFSNNLNTNLQTPGFLKRTSFINSTITGKASLIKRDIGIKVSNLCR